VRRNLCDARPQEIRTLAALGEAAHLSIGRAREYPADARTTWSEEHIPALRQQQLQGAAGTIRHEVIALEADRLSRRATECVLARVAAQRTRGLPSWRIQWYRVYLRGGKAPAICSRAPGIAAAVRPGASASTSAWVARSSAMVVATAGCAEDSAAAAALRVWTPLTIAASKMIVRSSSLLMGPPGLASLTCIGRLGKSPAHLKCPQRAILECC
jgi:hypothetical protein